MSFTVVAPPPSPLASIAQGQRWMSDAEPELGLGIVVALDERAVSVAFPASDETRRYAIRSAPLRRVRFVAGDTIVDDRGFSHRVESVEDHEGIAIYLCEDGELPETRLGATVALAGPRERLAKGNVDSGALFELRVETLAKLHEMRSSPVRGFAGPRIELLPHQFSVAAEVSARLAPRVLLADETGLGKTIEAGLILSRLLASGRASRVLVLVPDSLVHQWMVELRRRFQLRFSVFDEERCKGSEDDDPGFNPFEQEQLILAGLSLVAGNGKRTSQAAEAGWDIVVVDEAHHLEWTKDAASADYLAVEAVARRSEGLLLLTATPQQLGEEGHFARLRLLDPDRYGDFGRWIREADDYREVAAIARELLAGRELDAGAAARLAAFVGASPDEVKRRSADAVLRTGLVEELLDRHGPGRVMFRNTRAAVSGFPEREVHRLPLAVAGDDAALRERLQVELSGDFAASPVETIDLAGDPRIAWLVSLLAKPEPRKVLVLCSSAAKAQAIDAAIADRLRISTAVFHEGLTLLQRDRGAAWFAEADGARLLVCSELGSEGRNFQHAQHLVFFDVPADPDLVEQRIGRLDRIGQRGRVHVHLPFLAGGGTEVLVRWMDEGVNAFRQPSLLGRPLLERFGAELKALALRATAEGFAAVSREVDALITQTSAAAAELATRVEQGRDRLLEMASMRTEVAGPLIASVIESDRDTRFEDYLLRLLEHFHVYAEEIDARTHLLNPDGTESPEFPSLDRGETALTFDRAMALVREDLQFTTPDHPLVGDAMELMLASPAGNSAFAVVESEEAPRLFLETHFVLESVAPPRLHADRFLAPTPIRVCVDQRGAEADADSWPHTDDFVDGSVRWVVQKQALLAPLLAKMHTACETFAEERAARLRSVARAAMRTRLDAELDRLTALAAVNDAIRPEERVALENQRDGLAEAIDGARLRPEAVRLVWVGPVVEGTPVASR